MKKFILLIGITFFLIVNTFANANQQEEDSVFGNVQKVIARIYIEHEIDGRKTTVRGCGIVMKLSLKGSNYYFVSTAYHIIEDILKIRNIKCKIFVNDSEGIKYWSDDIHSEHIIWLNREMDAAIIVLPENLTHGPLPEGYEFPGIAFMKDITNASRGQEVFMMGYRWQTAESATPILKKGIISAVTKDLPNYEGHHVFLIDKMANKGMSGGPLFTDDGSGIAMISSYVLEKNQRLRTSDDLTVCIPLSILLKELRTVISKDEDKIINLLRKK